jgi:hypothetical protein
MLLGAAAADFAKNRRAFASQQRSSDPLQKNRALFFSLGCMVFLSISEKMRMKEEMHHILTVDFIN